MKHNPIYTQGWRLRSLGFALLMAACSATISQAQFQLVNDFEAGMGDFAFSQDPWGTGNAETVADPVAGEGNQVLAINAGDVNTSNLKVTNPIPAIPDGGMGTVFFRFAVDDSLTAVNGTFAISPLEAPAGWGDANILFNPSSDGSINVRNGGTYQQVAASRANLTWYKVWYVADTTNDTVDIYLKGGVYSEATLIADGFGFRKNAVGEDLISFFIYMNSGGSGAEDPNTNGLYYLDDIHVDSAAENLSDPMPDALPAPAFVLVNDFEDGLGVTSFTQNAWGTGNATTVMDPFPVGDMNNQALAINAGDVNTSNFVVVTPIPNIPDNSVGTVFLRFGTDRTLSNLSGTLAVSPLESPAGWGDANALLVPAIEGVINYRDGSAYTTVADSWTDLTWYRVWYHLNTGDDTSSLYIQGGEYAEPTLLAENFAFRKNTTGEDLLSLLFFFNSGGANAEDPNLNGTVYVDDIYVDTASLNFSDPWKAGNFQPLSFGFIPRDSAPVLDGVKDGLYRHSIPIAVVPESQAGKISGLADMSGEVSGIHTAEGLYLWIDVLDADLIVDSPGMPWNDDLIQIFIDGDSNGGGNFDGHNDVAFNVSPNGDGTANFSPAGFPAPPTASDFSGLDIAWVETPGTGYTAELFIPWEALNILPRPIWEIGLDIMLNDDDDGGDRDGWVTFSADGGNNQTDRYSKATLYDVREAQVFPVKSGTVIVDGELDSLYEGRWYGVNRWTDALSGPEGSAQFITGYDAENFYLFLEVTDANVVSDSTFPWQDDGVEVALDGNLNRGGGFDRMDDVKMTFRLLDLDGTLEVITTTNFPAPPAGTDFSGLESAAVITETGWIIEIKMPWSIIKFAPEPGAAFGFELNVNDDDDGGDRDGVLTWSSAEGVNDNTDEYGVASLWSPAVATVADTSETIVIDGEIDDAYMTTEWYLFTRFEESGNDIGPIWAGIYDSENFYVIIDVVDDDISYDSGSQPWNDDNVEFYFDPSNDGSGAFDGVEDVKVTAVLHPGEPSPDLYTTSNFPSPPAGTDFSDLEVAWIETAYGWRMEAKFPFAMLRLDNPRYGQEMGFDIAIGDDDFGGGRDSMIQWSTIGEPNSSTHLFGTVILMGEVDLPWTNLMPGESGNSPWFGAFEMGGNGWVKHSELRWLYIGNVTSDSTMWFYSMYLDGWTWSSSETFPILYDSGSGDWVYFFHLPEVGVWVYNFTSGQWELDPE